MTTNLDVLKGSLMAEEFEEINTPGLFISCSLRSCMTLLSGCSYISNSLILQLFSLPYSMYKAGNQRCRERKGTVPTVLSCPCNVAPV